MLLTNFECILQLLMSIKYSRIVRNWATSRKSRTGTLGHLLENNVTLDFLSRKVLLILHKTSLQKLKKHVKCVYEKFYYELIFFIRHILLLLKRIIAR